MKNAWNNQVGMLGDMFLWLVANLKQGVIYFIKQGAGIIKLHECMYDDIKISFQDYRPFQRFFNIENSSLICVLQKWIQIIFIRHLIFRVVDYGFTKLIELFEAIPTTIDNFFLA